MDSYDAPLHGGPSSYKLLKAFDDSVSFNLAYGYRSEPSESYNRIQELLGRNYVETPNYQLPFYSDGPLRLVQQTIAREWNYCFAYAVLNYPSWDYDAPASIPCFDN